MHIRTYGSSAVPVRALALAAALSVMPLAHADGLTFANIQPHEYELPVDYKPFNLLVQYGWWNSSVTRFDSGGDKVKGANVDTAVSLTKYVRFFKVDSMPSVGWGVVAAVPFVRVQSDSLGLSGMSDPLVGVGAWIKPTPTSTLGIQTYLQLPFGDSDLSGHYWGSLSSVFYDVQWNRFSFSGNTGFVLRGTRHVSGAADLDKGTTWHTNNRLGYKLSASVEPYIGLDYQVTGSDKTESSGQRVANSSSRESLASLGLMFTLAPNSALAVSWAKSLSGRNTGETNALYARFTYAF